MRVDTSFEKVRNLTFVLESEEFKDYAALERIEKGITSDYPNIYVHWVLLQDSEEVPPAKLSRILLVGKTSTDWLGRWKDEAVKSYLEKSMDLTVCLGEISGKLGVKLVKSMDHGVLVGTMESKNLPMRVVVSSEGKSLDDQFATLKKYLNELNYEALD